LHSGIRQHGGVLLQRPRYDDYDDDHYRGAASRARLISTLTAPHLDQDAGYEQNPT
jgi:hypothetical protein